LRLRDLDVVLAEARAAGMRLDVPWDAAEV
jgi:hypothetical protein